MIETPSLWANLRQHPVRILAVLCVIGILIYLGILAHSGLDVLTSPDWCAKAIQAERITPGTTFVGLVACVDLLKLQLAAVATGFHIVLYGFVGAQLVLVIIVLAGAKGSFTGPGGTGINVTPAGEAAAAGAAAVAKVADDKAVEIKKDPAAADPRPAQ